MNADDGTEAQRRIDELHQRLALAIRGSGFGVWEFDPSTGVLTWDAAMYSLYGHTRETFDSTPDAWRACLHPEDRELVDRRFGDLLAGRAVEIFEFRIIRASDGALRYVEANGVPQLDANGGVVRLVGMNRDATERKQQAHELMRLTNLLEMTQTTARIGGFEVDLARGEVFWTPEIYRLRELPVGAPTPTIEAALLSYTEPSRTCLRRAWDETVNHGTPFALDAELITARGSLRRVHVTGAPQREDGRVVKVHGAIQDITERSREHAALAASKERLHFVLSATPAVLYTARATGDFAATYASENVERLTGYPPRAFVDNPRFWISHVHPDDTGAIEAHFQHLFSHGQSAIEYRFLCADGAYRFMRDEVRLIRDERGEPLEMVGYWFDIHGRRIAEATIVESQARIQNLLHSTAAILWEADPKTFRFTFVSEQAERLLGYPCEAWLSDPNFWRDHIHPEDRERTVRACMASVQSCESHRLEYRMLTANGRSVWVEDLVTVFSDNSEPTLMRGVILDVSERKALEERLRHAEKMELIGQLAGGVAHDFNNLLAAMMLSIEHLRGGHAPARGVSPLDDLEAMAKRAAALTSQLLTFARRNELRVEAIEVSNLLENTLKLLGRVLGPNVRIEFTRAAHELWVAGDAALLEQAFVNLCVNARDAMPDGGTLALSVSSWHTQPSGPSVPGDAKPGDFVHVRVRDTGTGMTPEVVQHIFEPFFTTKEVGKGTGLGLASVHGTVHQHGGWIAVRSAPGEGTVFDVFLPQAAADALSRARNQASTSERATPTSIPRGTETVLLVEDEAAVRRLIARMLERLGYSVLIAADAPEARTLWQEHAAHIDVLLADIMMPGGITGRQLSDMLRADRPSLRVLLMTGGRLGTVHATSSGGTPDVLAKPFSANDLALALRSCLDR